MRSTKSLKKFYQKKIAKMVYSFILQASGQSPEKVLELYNSFAKGWVETVRKVNKKYGEFILDYDTWEREWKENGYMKYITIAIPKQLPEAEQLKLKAAKTELIRLVFIIEGKTEHQRQRREYKYKAIFIMVRIKHFFKELFSKKQPA